jgi:hypothetical protein
MKKKLQFTLRSEATKGQWSRSEGHGMNQISRVCAVDPSLRSG